MSNDSADSPAQTLLIEVTNLVNQDNLLLELRHEEANCKSFSGKMTSVVCTASRFEFPKLSFISPSET